MKALKYESIMKKYQLVKGSLDERRRRLWAAAEAAALGYGGIAAVSRATQLDPATIAAGIRETHNDARQLLALQRQRKPGAGRKRAELKDPGLSRALGKHVEAHTRGDPGSALRWTSKSTANLADALTRQGHRVSPNTVARLLKQENYSLQGNRKRHEGAQHPDRNAQFEYINTMVEAFQQRGSPVISVDAKKKELVGNYLNAGKEWRPKGCPDEVNAYDFIGPAGKARPYGIYDTTHNEGWVSVGIDHETAQFAVESISRWWWQMGQWRYPQARQILIMADGGGSNSVRGRLWKKSLQDWADRTGLSVTVCHFPPGTSKWNKIEHRMFSQITKNWRGKPLVSHEVIIELIASTKTKTGLRICAELDRGAYKKGIRVSDREMAALSIERADFHGEWNYLICPRS
jgi:hypothetical protein